MGVRARQAVPGGRLELVDHGRTTAIRLLVKQPTEARVEDKFRLAAAFARELRGNWHDRNVEVPELLPSPNGSGIVCPPLGTPPESAITGFAPGHGEALTCRR